MKFNYLFAALVLTCSVQAVAQDARLNLSQGEVVQCLPVPNIETLKNYIQYENGRPVNGGIVTCTVVDGQPLPKNTKVSGEIISGPVRNSFGFAWSVIQLPGGNTMRMENGDDIGSFQGQDERLRLVFKSGIKLAGGLN